MKLALYELRLTTHSFQQYGERVEPIEFDVLRAQLLAHIANHNFYNSEDFIRIDDVWWIFVIQDHFLLLVTCYGRNQYFDLPRAKKWAKRNQDRINLRVSL